MCNVFFLLCFQFHGVTAVLDNNVSEKRNTKVNRNEQPEQKRFLNFSGNKPSTPILDTIDYPIHMKNLSIQVINIKFYFQLTKKIKRYENTPSQISISTHVCYRIYKL